jgi:FKBP-type peptidyl-prolyl cis-trans isomerase FkpA
MRALLHAISRSRFCAPRLRLLRWLVAGVCALALTACGPPPMPVEAGRIEGVQIEDTRAGNGEVARAGQRVQVHYRGFLYDERAQHARGEQFDESYARGRPFEFVLGAGQVIRGWDQGIEGMQVGAMRVLKMGPEFGYGDRGAGNAIPPGASLVFELELLAAKND